MKYKVIVERLVSHEFEVEAEDEMEADEIAEKEFDELEFRGFELFTTYNNVIEEIKESEDKQC